MLTINTPNPHAQTLAGYRSLALAAIVRAIRDLRKPNHGADVGAGIASARDWLLSEGVLWYELLGYNPDVLRAHVLAMIEPAKSNDAVRGEGIYDTINDG